MKTHYNRAKAGSAKTESLCRTSFPGLNCAWFTRNKARVTCLSCLRILDGQQVRGAR